MDKREQLIEFIVQDIIVFIIEKLSIEFDQAMLMLYKSKTFSKLQDIETGLYSQSSSYVYDLFEDELKYGKFVQNEL